MTKRNNMGDSIGEPDEDGIAEWYPNCKVRFDGSHYIATPHTTNPARRRKRKEEIITVSEQDGKLKLKKPPPILELNDEIKPVPPEQVTVEEVIEKNKETPSAITDEPKTNIKRTTRKQVFDELYDKYLYLKPKERKKAVTEDMRPLFKTEVALQSFIEENCHRRWRNVVERRKRFARKAYN